MSTSRTLFHVIVYGIFLDGNPPEYLKDRVEKMKKEIRQEICKIGDSSGPAKHVVFSFPIDPSATGKEIILDFKTNDVATMDSSWKGTASWKTSDVIKKHFKGKTILEAFH